MTTFAAHVAEVSRHLSQLTRHVAMHRRAAGDPRLQGAPLRVYLHVAEQLDDVEYRPVKVRAIAVALRLEYRTAALALQRLAECGFLDAGAKVDRVRSYRVVIEQ